MVDLEAEEFEPEELELDPEELELDPEELELDPEELELDPDSTLESTLDTLLTPGLTFIQALRNDRNISAHPLQASTKARMATSLDPVDVPMRSTISSLRGCGTSYPT